MSDEKREEREALTFEVAERQPVAAEDERARPVRWHWSSANRYLKASGRSIALLALGLGAFMVWGLLPESESPPEATVQRLGVAHADIVEPPESGTEASEPERMKQENRSKPLRKRGRPKVRKGAHVTFSLGGETAGSVSTPPSSTSSQPAQSQPPPKTKKKASKPKAPVPTLSFRRVVKDKTGNHYHSTVDADIQSRLDRGFVLRETVGYLFAEQVKGTKMLAIDEGVMGWIYSADQGRKTVPLYRLTGPDYHDYEVIFTSSEDAKTKWEGEGWRVTRIEGYITISR